MHKNCIQVSISNMCTEWNIIEELLAFQEFGIDYSNRLNSEAINKKLRPRQVCSFKKFCKYILGLKLDEWCKDGKYTEKIKYGIDNNYYILCGYDNYYLPWGKTFLDTHILHFFNIIGMDEDGNVVCCDLYNGQPKQVLEYNLLEKGYKVAYYVTKKFNGVEDLKNFVQLFEFIIKNINMSDINSSYKSLKNALLHVQNYEQLFETENHEACELLIILKHMVESEKNKADFIKNNNMVCDDNINRFVESLFDVSNKWNQILQNFIYMKIRKKINYMLLDESLIIINEICNEQNLQYKSMLKYIDNMKG